MNNENHQALIFRLRKRAEIRRQISSRKSVQEGKPDRLADLLDEAADRIEVLENGRHEIVDFTLALINRYTEMIESLQEAVDSTTNYLAQDKLDMAIFAYKQVLKDITAYKTYYESRYT